MKNIIQEILIIVGILIILGFMAFMLVSITDWVISNNHGGSYHPTLLEIIIDKVNFLKTLRIW